MKAIYCPIETSLNFQQANKLLKDLKPGNIVIPESYTQQPTMALHKTHLIIDQGPDKPLITFKRGEVIKLPPKRKRNRVFLTPEIAATIVQKEVKPGLSLSTLTGYLQVKDNLHNITLILRSINYVKIKNVESFLCQKVFLLLVMLAMLVLLLVIMLVAVGYSVFLLVLLLAIMLVAVGFAVGHVGDVGFAMSENLALRHISKLLTVDGSSNTAMKLPEPVFQNTVQQDEANEIASEYLHNKYDPVEEASIAQRMVPLLNSEQKS
ncbi:Integrator complex subunit 9 [Pseudolycoriella hygida]|uniref:Integrator complex subunit 9 n=1 Tax=Pseudolycoriella hygida TaxID=35572 RepID=A0A9Q0N336_9DIPT|nr:Integrator complex subunit 9 [Pseudolycoriella hygida]